MAPHPSNSCLKKIQWAEEPGTFAVHGLTRADTTEQLNTAYILLESCEEFLRSNMAGME